jgi:hypothetical protein
LGASGAVGAWTNYTSGSSALPVAVNSASGAAYNGYIYSVGGSTGATQTVDVFYAKPNPTSGAISSWTSYTAGTSALPTATQSGTAQAYNGYLYYLGGQTGAGAVHTVYYAALDPNTGAVGAWTATTSMPSTCGGNGNTSIVAGNSLYVLGGNNGGYLNAVCQGIINGDGTISSWAQLTNTLGDSVNFAASVYYNGYGYYMGGTNGTRTTATYYAQFPGTSTTGYGTITSSGNFIVQTAASAQIFAADTGAGKVQIGPSAGDTVGELLVLGNKTNSGDPTGVAGAMYYNSNLNAFRCFQNGLWQNCLLDGDGMTTMGFASDDFYNNGATAGNGTPWTCAAIASGTFPSGTVTGRSIAVVTSSTSANSGFQCSTGLDTVLGGGETFETIIDPLTFTNTTVRTGFRDTFTSAVPANGCWLNITTTPAVTDQCAKAGALSTGGLSFTPSTATWYRLKIQIVSTTSVTATVYSSAGAVLATDTFTPANGEPLVAVGSGFTSTNSGTTATALDNIDEISTWYNGLSFR